MCGIKHLHRTVEHRGASEEYRMIVFNNRYEKMLLDLQQEFFSKFSSIKLKVKRPNKQ